MSDWYMREPDPKKRSMANLPRLYQKYIGHDNKIPLVLDMQLPRGDVPNPIAPQTWHFRQSIEYSLTNNYAVLDIASKRKEDFLLNMYRMGRNAIENGSRDHWTIHPSRINAAKAEMAKAASRGSIRPRR